MKNNTTEQIKVSKLIQSFCIYNTKEINKNYVEILDFLFNILYYEFHYTLFENMFEFIVINRQHIKNYYEDKIYLRHNARTMKQVYSENMHYSGFGIPVFFECLEDLTYDNNKTTLLIEDLLLSFFRLLNYKSIEINCDYMKSLCDDLCDLIKD